MSFRKAIILVAMAMTILSTHLNAEENADTEQQPAVLSGGIPTMGQVTVVGAAENLVSGSSILTSDVLQALPKKNSSITETVTILPRVQTGEGQRTSENSGEILPPLISISGGRAYENNYSIDGIDLSSILDPLTGNNIAETIRDVPSHPQRGFIHQDLIDTVKVYDSNIPARFGGFTGGVVDAETRAPQNEFAGQFSFRSTRDSWTEFHINSDRKDEFYRSTDQQLQPRFKKYDFGLELDVPINNEMAFLAAYKMIRSDLEIFNIDDWDENRKTLESYFLKYVWLPQTPYSLELTASHTPSREDFFIDGARDSDIEIERGGYSFSGKLTGQLPFGILEASSSYTTNDSSREANPIHYFWPSDTPSKSWGDQYGLPWSAEGGYGDIDNEETSLQASLDLVTQPMAVKQTIHTFNLGLEGSHDKGSFDRKQTTYEHALNRAVEDLTVVCDANDLSCISNEVYFRERRVYFAEAQEAKVNSFAAYLDDLIETGPFTFRPGIRISYDDFMENTDLAYRFAGTWDLFRNTKTVIKGGYNRYYGKALLTYKLREGRTPYLRQTRSMNPDGSLTNWVPETSEALLRYQYSELDTPYSDEWNIGVVQQVLGGRLEINYLERDNRDQFAKELFTTVVDGTTIRGWQLNNNGSSDYKSTKISWERQWLNHYLNINYTYSDQESSNESYDDTFDEDDLEDSVWYQGKLVSLDDLPRPDYNRDHILNIIYVGRLPGNFTFTSVARYQSGYETLEDTRDNITLPSGERYDIYAKVEQPDYWIFDWRIDWEKMVLQNQSLVFSLEINNVFNRTPPAGDANDIYELGRQYWLGMTYNF